VASRPTTAVTRPTSLLTRSGLGAAVVAVLAGMLGWWWRYEELVVLAGGLTAAVVVATWSARVGGSARIIRRVATPRVARGDDLRMSYRVSNRGRRRTATATIADRCDDAVVRTAVPVVTADGEIDLPAHIPTRRRGVHQLGPWTLERRDPFGLALGRRTSDATSTILVHPRVHPLSGPQGSMHAAEADSAVRRVASDPLSGFVSLREYVPGDDPRLIHWPTTARLGTLMLREHVEIRRPEFTVVVDACDAVATADDFEEVVDVAASIAVHAIRSGIDVTVRTTAPDHRGTRHPIDHEPEVLDRLTPVGQVAAGVAIPLSELFAGGLDHTSIVMVTGPHGPASRLARSDAVSVVRIGHGAEAVPGIALAADDAATFAARWRPWR